MKPKPLAALNHFTVPDAMSYLLWGSTPDPQFTEYRVAAMMPRPKNDRKYKTLPVAENADEGVEVLGTTTATEINSSMR
jgi:hypothetical protein